MDYSAHAILHWITSNAMYEVWPTEVREKNIFFRLLRVFLNPCDLAMGRIASKLDICPPSPFCEEELVEDCSLLADMLKR